MDNTGNMVLGNPASAKGLSWNQSTGDLVISGDITITGGNAATTDDVTTAVNGIQVGGRNLLPNGDFHNNTTYYSSNGYTSFTQLASNLPSGFSYGGEFVVPSKNNGFYINLSNVYGSSFVFESGQVYTISLYAKANDTVSMNYGMEHVAQSNITLSTSWQRFSYQVTGDGSNHSIVFYPQAACTLDITGMQVEEGNKVTAFKYSQLDVDNSIIDSQQAAQNYATTNCVKTDASNAPSSIMNSTVSIGSDGTLNNAGGGKVTIRGLGYTGALDATNGATWGTDLHNIPDELGKPSAPGIYLTGTSMGVS